MSRAIGIDIGSFSVKIAVVNYRNRSYSFDDFHEFPLNPNPNSDHDIEIIDILRKVAEKYDDGHTKFVLGLPQKFVSSRICSFPFKERHKVLKSVAFELEDDIPLTYENAIFDAKITRYFKNASEVLAFAAPKEVIQNLINLSKDSLIPVSSLSVEGLAFANLFEAWQQGPVDAKNSYNPHEELEDDEDDDLEEPDWETTAIDMILHIGHSQTIVLFVEGQRIIDTKSIDWGGINIANTLGKKYKIQPYEALKELMSKSFILLNNNEGDKNQAVYSDTVKASIDDLYKELKLLIIAVESKFRLELDNIKIVGGVSRIKNIGAYLTQKLERPVNRLTEFSMAPFVEFSAGAQYGVNGGPAVGLAIEAFKKPINPAANLLKDEFAKKSEQWVNFWNKWGTTVKYLSAVFMILLVYGIARDSMTATMKETARSTLKKHATKIAQLPKSKANARNVEKYIKNQKSELKAIEMADKVQTIGSALQVLKKLSSSMPAKSAVKLNVKSLNIVNGYMDIQGEVASRQQLQSVERSLKGMSVDGKVKKTNARLQTSPGRIPFSFRVNVQIEGGV